MLQARRLAACLETMVGKGVGGAAPVPVPVLGRLLGIACRLRRSSQFLGFGVLSISSLPPGSWRAS